MRQYCHFDDDIVWIASEKSPHLCEYDTAKHNTSVVGSPSIGYDGSLKLPLALGAVE